MDENGGESHNKQRIQPSKQDPEPSIYRRIAQVTSGVCKRKYLLEVLPVLLIFVLPMSAHAGIFSTLVGVFTSETQAEAVSTTYNAQTVPLLRAATHPDPNPSKGGGDILVDETGALVPGGGPNGTGNTEVNESNGEISVYIVREADALSQIAEMFGVSANTILWANDIDSPDIIQPGDTLVILPISGVRHVVKDGDTLEAIAKKYGGDVDDIISYNQLASASDIVTGDTVVVPGGEVEAPPAPKHSVAASAPVQTYSGPSAGGYYSHPLPGAVRTQGLHGYNGVDLGAPAGTPILAAAAGDVILVRSSGWNGGYGNYVVVKHANGTQTLYAHMSSVAASVGQRVSTGQVIGYVGSTGRSTGNHVHFEVRGARNPF